MSVSFACAHSTLDDQEDENRFLTLKYNVANLGDLRFFLVTKTADA